jgi:hypothetical protein
MRTAVEFVADAWGAAMGVDPRDPDWQNVDLYLDDAPEPGDNVWDYHPDRPDEPVVWGHWLRDEGLRLNGVPIPYARRLQVKRSFVEECLAGDVKAVDNAPQWFFDRLVRHFRFSRMLRI